MIRRPLSEVVTELAESVQPDPVRHAGLRVSRLAVDLPLEVELARESDELVVRAEMPRWRWRSYFDREPGRMAIELREEPVS